MSSETRSEIAREDRLHEAQKLKGCSCTSCRLEEAEAALGQHRRAVEKAIKELTSDELIDPLLSLHGDLIERVCRASAILNNLKETDEKE